MMKLLPAAFLSAGVGLGLGLVGSVGAANAHGSRPGCAACGPVAPTTLYKTVHPQKYVTRFHDVHQTRRVHRVHRIITVTRVQPVIHIHEVTRVHHHTVVSTSDAYSSVTRHLAPIRLYQRSVRNYYDCGCGS